MTRPGYISGAASLRDAEKAVSLDDANIKAWSRLAKAHLELLRAEDTRAALRRGLALDPENKDLRRIKARLRELTEPLIQ